MINWKKLAVILTASAALLCGCTQSNIVSPTSGTIEGDGVPDLEVNEDIPIDWLEVREDLRDAFMDPSLHGLTSANSINLGRLLPQVVYYVWASFIYKARYGKEAVFIVPSGNVGNSTGAFWAKAMGAPIKHIELAVNANRTISSNATSLVTFFMIDPPSGLLHFPIVHQFLTEYHLKSSFTSSTWSPRTMIW